MTWLRLEYGLLLLPACLLAYALWYYPKKSNPWQGIIDPELLAFLLPGQGTRKYSPVFAGLIAAWLLGILALVGPSLKEKLLPETKQLVPKIILLDLSPGMLKSDIAPNRLSRAKFKIADLLKSSHETEVALVAFSEEPFLVAPFTEDQRTVLNLLERLHPNLMPVEGNRIDKALEFAGELFKKNARTRGEVLLLTGSIPSPGDFDPARQLADNGYRLSVWAFGKSENLPKSTYQTLASAGRGRLVVFQNGESDVETLSRPLVDGTLTERIDQRYAREDSGYLLTFVIALIILLGFRRGWYEQLTGL